MCVGWLGRAIVIAAVAVVSACGNAAAVPSISPTVSPTTRVPTQTEGTVPNELRGAWKTTLATTNESITLTLTDRTYSIKRGLTTGTGNLTLRGSDVIFSASPLCDGEGVYRWSVQSGSLRFVAVSPDPCGGRVEVLQDQTYQRG